jgi:hypothetical protein
VSTCRDPPSSAQLTARSVSPPPGICQTPKPSDDISTRRRASCRGCAGHAYGDSVAPPSAVIVPRSVVVFVVVVVGVVAVVVGAVVELVVGAVVELVVGAVVVELVVVVVGAVELVEVVGLN